MREILISESAWEEMTCLFAPSLDNLKSLYESGGLKDLEYEEEVADWTVLNDGIDPKLSEPAIKVCSES
ncbi:TPA: hypothetical protein ACXF92_002943 [Klebsiella pneumoniae]